MSTKINVRSPFYISIESPTAPTPVFDKTYANPQGFSVDVNGNLSLPILDYGTIEDVTSDDPDFANDKFPAEAAETNRTVRLHVRVPEGFSNAGDLVSFEVSAIQPGTIAACSGELSATASTITVNLNTGGSSTTVDMSTHFTGAGSKDQYVVNNLHPSYFEASIASNGVLTLTSKSQAGTFNATVLVFDNDTGCSAAKTVSVVLTSLTTFTTADVDLEGGEIEADGTIIDPSVIGTISARRLTTDGTPITSHTSNDTGSARDVTLFFDITVPQGYSNAGATVQVSKTFSQPPTNVTPVFDVDAVGVFEVRENAILQNGQVVAGTASYRYGGQTYYPVIQSVSPTSFARVNTSTSRDVTYTLVIPSGFQNAGNTVTKVITMTQPPSDIEVTGQPCQFHTHVIYTRSTIFRTYGEISTFNTHYARNFLFDWNRADTTDPAALAGKRLCFNGSPLAKGTYYVGFSFTRGASNMNSTNTPIEHFYYQVNGLITAVYRKDWNTLTVTRIA